ncbi:MAG: TIGR03086 family metal-binding protein [Microthrixaceae bacterium]
MDGKEQLTIIIPMLNEVARGIEERHLTNPTPCTELTVAGVLEHMIGLGSMFAPMFRGEDPTELDAADAPETPRTERFQAVMDDLLAAVNSPGALDRTIQTPGGPMPGAAFARMVALDGLVHGWDLASSTGQPWLPPRNSWSRSTPSPAKPFQTICEPAEHSVPSATLRPTPQRWRG